MMTTSRESRNADVRPDAGRHSTSFPIGGFALLLDWHVYALLAPFIALGLGAERGVGAARLAGIEGKRA